MMMMTFVTRQGLHRRHVMFLIITLCCIALLLFSRMRWPYIITNNNKSVITIPTIINVGMAIDLIRLKSFSFSLWESATKDPFIHYNIHRRQEQHNDPLHSMSRKLKERSYRAIWSLYSSSSSSSSDDYDTSPSSPASSSSSSTAAAATSTTTDTRNYSPYQKIDDDLFDNDRGETSDLAHQVLDCDDLAGFEFEGDALEECLEEQQEQQQQQQEQANTEEDAAAAAAAATTTTDPSSSSSTTTDTTGPASAPPASTPAPAVTPPILLENGIRVEFSMGIIHLEHLYKVETDTIVTMCLRATTKILNLDTNYWVRDNLTTPPSNRGYHHHHGHERQRRERHQRYLLQPSITTNKPYQLSFQHPPYHPNNHNYQYDYDQTDDTTTSTSTTTGTTRQLSKHQQPDAKLFLHSVFIHESTHMKDWFTLTADYGAHWPNTGRPIQTQTFLRQITSDCQFTINEALLQKEMWSILQELPFGQYLLLHKNDVPFDEDDKGLADCSPVGNEYDLLPYYLDESSSSDEYDENGTYIGAGPEYGMTTGDTNDGTMNWDKEIATYEDVIADTPGDIVWNVREWVGLGLMTFTLLVVITTSLIAHRLEQRRIQQQIWGIPLTEEGVKEMLQVGWRYTQQTTTHDGSGENDNGHGGNFTNANGNVRTTTNTNSNTNLSDPQLYLQIYDKTHLGYNDENSMLQGGVEQCNVHGYTSDEDVSSKNLPH